MKKRIIAYVLLWLPVFVNGSMASEGFVRENLKTFHEFRLGNGIPVVVKKTGQSRIRSVCVAVKGGKALVQADKAGLDKVTAKLMTMESKKYSDVARRALLKKTTATISASDGLDYTQYALKTIDSYFDETFDLFADLFINPAFSERFFNELIISLKSAYRSDLTDGYARASYAVNRQFFAGHPYSSYLYTVKTLEAVTLDDVKKFYKDNYTASRIIVCAVGDFDIDALKKKLDATFGTIGQGTRAEEGGSGFALSPTPPLSLDSYSDLKKEVSYVRGNFPAPGITDTDYWALKLGTSIISDILNDMVRTKNGMAYSVWAHLYAKQSNYGNISIYKTNNPAGVIKLIRKSIDIAAQGRCLSPFTGNGNSGGYVSLEQALDFYKVSFSTKFYSGLQDNTSIALKMADSYVHTGDCLNYLYVMNTVGSVTAQDVVRAVRSYVSGASIYWAVTAHPETVSLLEKDPREYAASAQTVILQ